MTARLRVQAARVTLVFLAFCLLTVAATWPVVPRFSTHVAGLPARDSLQYTWALWWGGYAWERGASPAQATLINYPWRVEHPLLGATAELEILAWPLEHWLSPTQVFNLLFLLSFVLCGTSMFLLASDLVNAPIAAFLAGAVYAFGAHRTGQALAGHLPQLATWWLPLLVLHGRRLALHGRWRDAVLSGLLLGLSLEIALVVTAYVVLPLVALCVAFTLFQRRWRIGNRLWHQAAVAFAIAALLTTPTYAPFLVKTVLSGADYAISGSASDHSVDLAGFVMPSRYHPLWPALLGRFVDTTRLMAEADDVERSAYVGWACIGLAIVAMMRCARACRPWLVLVAVSGILSLGPSLHVYGSDTGARMPYILLQKIPFMAWGRTPERYAMLTAFGMAVLAGLGLDRIRARPAVLALLATVAVLDLCAMWPYPGGTPRPSDIVRERADVPGAVLHLPPEKRQVSNIAMYYQTEDHRAIVGGYIHRDLPGMRTYAKTLGMVCTSQNAQASRAATPTEVLGLLSGLGIGDVWVHREWATRDWIDNAAARLGVALGPPVLDLPDAFVYRVPESRPSGQVLAEWPAFALRSLTAEPQVSAGTAITVTSEWHTRMRPASDLTLYVHLLDPKGDRVAQHDGEPLAGNWPTTLWAAGTVVIDQRDLVLPADLAPGRYSIGLGWYDRDTHEPISATMPAGAGVGPMILAEPQVDVLLLAAEQHR